MISQLAFGIDGAMMIAFFVGIFAMMVAGSEIMLHGIVIPLCGACYSFFRGMTQLQFSTSSGESGIGTGDFAYKLITNSAIQKLFTTLLIVAIVLLVISTIIKAITSEFNFQKDGNSKSKILLDAVKALALFVIVPIASILGLMLANFLLGVIVKALENAVGVADAGALTGLLRSIVGNVGWGNALNQVLSIFGVMNFILIGCMWPVAKKLLGAVIGMFQRMFELAMLWAISAPIIALMPLTESPYKSWVKEYTQRVLGLFGIVVSVNVIVFVIQLACSLIGDLKLESFEEFIGQLAIVYAGMAMLDSLASSIASIIGGREYGTEGAKLGANMFAAVGKGVGSAFKVGSLARAGTGMVGGAVQGHKAKKTEKEANVDKAAAAQADKTEAVADENKKVDEAKKKVDAAKKKQANLPKNAIKAQREQAAKDVADAEKELKDAETERDRVKDEEKQRILKDKNFRRNVGRRMGTTSLQDEQIAEAKKLAELAGETDKDGNSTENAKNAAKALGAMKEKMKESGLSNHAINKALDKLAKGDVSALGSLTAELSDIEQFGKKHLPFGGKAQLSRLVADREQEAETLHKKVGTTKTEFEEADAAAAETMQQIKTHRKTISDLETKENRTKEDDTQLIAARGALSNLEQSDVYKNRQQKLTSYMSAQQAAAKNDKFIEQTHKMMQAPSTFKTATQLATGTIMTFADSFFNDPTVQKAWSPVKSGWHGLFEGTPVDITAEGVKAAEEKSKKNIKERYQVTVDAHERAELAAKVEAGGKTIAQRITMQSTQNATLSSNVTEMQNAKDAAIADIRRQIRVAFDNKTRTKDVPIKLGDTTVFTIKPGDMNADIYLEQVATSGAISTYTTAIQAQTRINQAIQDNDTATLDSVLRDKAMVEAIRKIYLSNDVAISTEGLDPKIQKLIVDIENIDIESGTPEQVEAILATLAQSGKDAAKAYDDIKDLAEKAKKLKEARKKQQSSGAPKYGDGKK